MSSIFYILICTAFCRRAHLQFAVGSALILRTKLQDVKHLITFALVYMRLKLYPFRHHTETDVKCTVVPPSYGRTE